MPAKYTEKLKDILEAIEDAQNWLEKTNKNEFYTRVCLRYAYDELESIYADMTAEENAFIEQMDSEFERICAKLESEDKNADS